MPELTPLDDNRQEHFLNGEDLEPITRREHFYAGRESELPAGHQEPETREEWFIQKYRGGGGDVTVVPLSVTENGTYSEEGKAYSPVQVSIPDPVLKTKNITDNGTYNASADNADGYSSVDVNVPLPQNAYLLKSVANLPQAIASFNDGEDMVMPSLKVAIEPQQEGSGDPSPTNVRPISGWDEVDVTRAGKNLFDKDHYKFAKGYLDGNGDWQGSKTIYDYPTEGLSYWSSVVIDITKFGTDTITYSGFVSVSGTLRGIVDENFTKLAFLGDSSTASYTVDLSQYPTAKYIVLSFMRDNHDFSNAQLEIGSTATTYEPYAGTTYTIDLDGTRYGGEVDVVNGIVTPAPYYASYNGETLTGEWISDRDKYEVGATPTIGAQVVNIGASGTPVSILPTAIKSLRGVNNVWADTGDITDAEYFSKEV